ncbi:MAG TPA: thiamine pyrophosphate-dependent enzyme [Deinococcales bacterium]|nr:thiamine pyrophosphate-dependent enzyme [Deinococcales bacterium]
MATTKPRPPAKGKPTPGGIPASPAGQFETPFQVLSPEGELLRPEYAPDPESIEKLYRQMVRIRYLDDRFIVLSRQNRMGGYPPFGGQEASQVGTVSALEPSDWLVPMYRNTGSGLAFGWSMLSAIQYWRTHPDGWRFPDELHMLPIIIDIASQYPHAAGVGMAMRMQGSDRVAMTYIGEGGTSQGDFHVGLNFASATKANTVFIIENNGWAISVPRKVQTAATVLAPRSAGYGMPGYLVDGNDVLAVNWVAREAVARARRGEGPSLIETITYRVRPHTTNDDPKAYRTEDESKVWSETRDPITRVRRYLEGAGLWNEDREAALHAEVASEFDAALAAADATAAPDPMVVMDNVMGAPTPNVVAQRRALEAAVQALEAQQ